HQRCHPPDRSYRRRGGAKSREEDPPGIPVHPDVRQRGRGRESVACRLQSQCAPRAFANRAESPIWIDVRLSVLRLNDSVTALSSAFLPTRLRAGLAVAAVSFSVPAVRSDRAPQVERAAVPDITQERLQLTRDRLSGLSPGDPLCQNPEVGRCVKGRSRAAA